jgi:hypothetical protein
MGQGEWRHESQTAVQPRALREGAVDRRLQVVVNGSILTPSNFCPPLSPCNRPRDRPFSKSCGIHDKIRITTLTKKNKLRITKWPWDVQPTHDRLYYSNLIYSFAVLGEFVKRMRVSTSSPHSATILSPYTLSCSSATSRGISYHESQAHPFTIVGEDT